MDRTLNEIIIDIVNFFKKLYLIIYTDTQLFFNKIFLVIREKLIGLYDLIFQTPLLKLIPILIFLILAFYFLPKSLIYYTDVFKVKYPGKLNTFFYFFFLFVATIITFTFLIKFGI